MARGKSLNAAAFGPVASASRRRIFPEQYAGHDLIRHSGVAQWGHEDPTQEAPSTLPQHKGVRDLRLLVRGTG